MEVDPKNLRHRSYEGLEAAPDRGEFLHVDESATSSARAAEYDPADEIRTPAPAYPPPPPPVPLPVPLPEHGLGILGFGATGTGTTTNPAAGHNNTTTNRRNHNNLSPNDEVSPESTLCYACQGLTLPSLNDTTLSATLLAAAAAAKAGADGEIPLVATRAMPPSLSRSSSRTLLKPTLSSRGLHRPSPPPGRTILGLRKPTFFLLLSNAILFIIVVFLAVLSALNASRGHSAFGSPSRASSSCNATDSPSTQETPLAENPQICFETTKAPAKGQALGWPTSECPLVAGKQYTVPGTKLTFQRSCESDFTGNDMAQIPVSSMEDCMAICAQLNLYPSSENGKCLGVSWVYGDGPQGTGVSYCFPKNNTDIKNYRSGTESALLQT